MTCSERHICPECVSGEHRNCTDDAWCFTHDRLTHCDCKACN